MKLNIPITEQRADPKTGQPVAGMKERLQYLRRFHGVNLGKLIDLVMETSMDPETLSAEGLTPEALRNAKAVGLYSWPVTYSMPFTVSEKHRPRIKALRAQGWPIAELVRAGLRSILRMDPEALISAQPDLLYKGIRVKREKGAAKADRLEQSAVVKADVASHVAKIISARLGIDVNEDKDPFPSGMVGRDDLRWRGRKLARRLPDPKAGEWMTGRITPVEETWSPPAYARQLKGGAPIGDLWPKLTISQKKALVRELGDFYSMRDAELIERCAQLSLNITTTAIEEARLILHSAIDPVGAREEMIRLHGAPGPLRRPRGRPKKENAEIEIVSGRIIDLETVVAQSTAPVVSGPVNVASDYLPGEEPDGATPIARPKRLLSFTELGPPELAMLAADLDWKEMNESSLSMQLMRRGLTSHLDFEDAVEHLRVARPATEEARKAFARIVELRSILGEMSALSNGEIVRSVRALRSEQFGNGSMLSAKLGDFERLRSPNASAQWVLLPPPDPIGDDDLEPIRANYGSLLPPKTSHLKVYCPGLTPEPIDMRHVPALLEEIERRIQIVMEGAVPTPRNKQVVPPKPPQRPETRPSALDALAFLSSKLVKPPAETTPKSTNVTSGGRQLSALHVAEQARAPVTLRPLSALGQYEMMHLRDPATMTDVEIVLLLDSMGYEGTPADYRALFQEEKRSITDLTGADLSEILDEFGGGAAFDEMTDEEVKQYFEAGWNVDASDVQAIRQHIKPKS